MLKKPSAGATALTTFRWVLLAAAMLSTAHGKGLVGSIDATKRATNAIAVPETPLRIKAVRSASTSTAFGDNLRYERRDAAYVASSGKSKSSAARRRVARASGTGDPFPSFPDLSHRPRCPADSKNSADCHMWSWTPTVAHPDPTTMDLQCEWVRDSHGGKCVCNRVPGFCGTSISTDTARTATSSTTTPRTATSSRPATAVNACDQPPRRASKVNCERAIAGNARCIWNSSTVASMPCVTELLTSTTTTTTTTTTTASATATASTHRVLPHSPITPPPHTNTPTNTPTSLAFLNRTSTSTSAMTMTDQIVLDWREDAAVASSTLAPVPCAIRPSLAGTKVPEDFFRSLHGAVALRSLTKGHKGAGASPLFVVVCGDTSVKRSEADRVLLRIKMTTKEKAACDSVTAALSSVGFLSTTEVWSPSLASILEGEIDDDGVCHPVAAYRSPATTTTATTSAEPPPSKDNSKASVQFDVRTAVTFGAVALFSAALLVGVKMRKRRKLNRDLPQGSTLLSTDSDDDDELIALRMVSPIARQARRTTPPMSSSSGDAVTSFPSSVSSREETWGTADSSFVHIHQDPTGLPLLSVPCAAHATHAAPPALPRVAVVHDSTAFNGILMPLDAAALLPPPTVLHGRRFTSVAQTDRNIAASGQHLGAVAGLNALRTMNEPSAAREETDISIALDKIIGNDPLQSPPLPEQSLTMGAPTTQKYRAVVAENVALKAELDDFKGKFAEFKALAELKALAAVQETSMTFSGQHLPAPLPRPQCPQRDHLSHPQAFIGEPVDDAYPGMHIYPAADVTWGESTLELGAAERNKYCKEQNLSGSAIANLKKASRMYKQSIARNKHRKMKRAKERGKSSSSSPDTKGYE